MKYCPNCERNVEGKKNFHGIAFTLIMIFVWSPLLCIEFGLFILGGIVYEIGVTTSDIFALPVLLGVVTFFSPLTYIFYHIFGKSPRCPICNTKNLQESTT